MNNLTGSFASHSSSRRRFDETEAGVTVTLVRAFDIGTELRTEVVRPASTFINVCVYTQTIY